ncbi:protein CHLOROPLAST J-LIKE DOMAIN 1, chloroplastic [Cryptomeria japonica]|uniref:protein CHLOROPLAST J-LIKE DOMAIN 1, chloroplastic n=1 Tax=Cryptomeria japonica TaxID=3369 RepID=UPI0027DA72A7|nr:protein CHLOROPLAST J-LIKE DOMAIN 1, chloroplastic [Cryptomeria japonica]
MAMAFTMKPACQNTLSGVKGGRRFNTSSQIHRIPKTLSFHILSSSSPPLSSPTRYSRQVLRNSRAACTAASVGGGSSTSGDDNPYKVLGVSPLEKFEKIKASYTRKYKDAERRGDDAAMAQLERAYDKIMMAQLSNRKQGLTFGSVKVSKDIKYADKQPIVPWGPRYARAEKNDILINFAVSLFFTGWIMYARSADYKPLQFLIFGYIFRMFEKLKSFEQPSIPSTTEELEDESQSVRTGKRLLRSLALVFGCVAVSSLAYTGILNAIEYLNFYIPQVLIKSQELFVTLCSAIALFLLGSYYR